MQSIIVKPIITEKSLNFAARGWYTFAVDLHANKYQIATAVQTLYPVEVKEVRTISMHGKTRRVGRKSKVVQQSDWKKALVHLKTGQRIEAFDVTTQAETK
jgi:large subunit ribosomal protein L23